MTALLPFVGLVMANLGFQGSRNSGAALAVAAP